MPSCDVATLEMRGSQFSFRAKKTWETIIKKIQSGKPLDIMQIPLLGIALLIYGYAAKIQSKKTKEFGVYNNYCTSLLLTVRML